MKGWLDNFGKADNANESNVSLPEGFVGLGYDTKGRNYSPAWGGQFQKGGQLTPVSPLQQVQQAVQPTPTVPYLQTKDPAEFYKSWIQSPEYARRQLLTGYSKGEDLYMPNAAASRESRLGAIEEMTPITYSARQPSEAKPGVYGSPSYVNINPSDYIDTSKEAIQAHELAHIAGAMGEVRPGMMSAKEQEIFKKSMLPMKEPVLSGVQGSKEREASKRALEDWKHSQEPDEAKADLDALRFMMYDKGIYDITKGKKFTETDFEKAKQNLGKDRVFKRLENRMGKKNFVNLMNTIALADEEEAPIAMGGMSIPGSVGFTYARVAGAAPSKGKYAKKTMASAQNGEEDIKTIDLPEIVVTAYDEEYPFYQSLSNEQKKYINDEGPIGRATRALAKTGKKGQTAKDISKVVRDVQQTGAEFTGIPGTIRFAQDPVKSTEGAGKTLLDLGLMAATPLAPITAPITYGALDGMNPITEEQLFNQQNLQGAFDTLDALGMVGGAAALLKQPVQKGFQLGSKSVGNIVNRSITPIGYDPFTVAAAPLELITPNALKFKPKTFATKNRFDAWRLYNGLDPKFDTFSKNPDGTLAINDFRLEPDDLQKIIDNPKESFGTMEIQPEFNFGGVHGNGWITKGVDEEGRKFIDFTDTWDLQPFAAFSKLPEKIRNFEVSSVSGGKPFDLKNRIYYDDKGNFFDHSGNKLVEEVQHFPKGVAKENEAVDIQMLSTPNVVGTKQTDVLKDWDNATNHKFIKGGLTSGIGVASVMGYLAAALAEKKRLKEDEKKGDDAVKEFQNGGEMRFYQNGLDWKPKSMQDGGKAEDSFLGKTKKFIAEEISDPLTMKALSLLNELKPINNKEIYGTVRPIEYPNIHKLPVHAYNYLMGNKTEPLTEVSGMPHIAEEFWATALNIPMDTQYLKESQYKPSTAKNPNAKYYTIRDIIDQDALMGAAKDLKAGEKMVMNGLLPILDSKWYSKNRKSSEGVDFEELDPLQRFTIQKSPDGSYVSIYDKYDFDNPALNRMMNSFEIYDRFYLEKKKDGGIVKDNDGYLNPNNFGKVVEIDSNDITMEGVYEPLLGVSDTGDTKLMKPGKNYKFKGKKVTEFPVAKLGINQLDAQPMKKLNQLLNFTNNPDKDNWLDKYN